MLFARLIFWDIHLKSSGEMEILFKFRTLILRRYAICCVRVLV
jgi:hypothetical protein